MPEGPYPRLLLYTSNEKNARTSLLIKHPYRAPTPPPQPPLVPVLLFEGFSPLNRLLNSSVSAEASPLISYFFVRVFLVLPNVSDINSFHPRTHLRGERWDLFSFPVARCGLHLTRLRCDKTNTKTLSQVKKASDYWIFLQQRVEKRAGGGRGVEGASNHWLQ